MMERKCFCCRDFRHIVHNCKNMENKQKERSSQRSLNKFKVLTSKVMNLGIPSGVKERKNRKSILRKEKLKEE